MIQTYLLCIRWKKCSSISGSTTVIDILNMHDMNNQTVLESKQVLWIIEGRSVSLTAGQQCHLIPWQPVGVGYSTEKKKRSLVVQGKWLYLMNVCECAWDDESTTYIWPDVDFWTGCIQHKKKSWFGVLNTPYTCLEGKYSFSISLGSVGMSARTEKLAQPKPSRLRHPDR